MTTSATSFENKCEILGELWLGYSSDEAFSDFIEYNDLGLPLAYAISNQIVLSSPQAEALITETFSILVVALGVEDTGFDSLDELLETSEIKAP